MQRAKHRNHSYYVLTEQVFPFDLCIGETPVPFIFIITIIFLFSRRRFVSIHPKLQTFPIVLDTRDTYLRSIHEENGMRTVTVKSARDIKTPQMTRLGPRGLKQPRGIQSGIRKHEKMSQGIEKTRLLIASRHSRPQRPRRAR